MSFESEEEEEKKMDGVGDESWGFRLGVMKREEKDEDTIEILWELLYVQCKNKKVGGYWLLYY